MTNEKLLEEIQALRKEVADFRTESRATTTTSTRLAWHLTVMTVSLALIVGAANFDRVGPQVAMILFGVIVGVAAPWLARARAKRE